MPRPSARLSAIEVSRAVARKRPCTLCDGGNLYFVSRPPNGASWMLRYGKDGKDRWMGLGAYPTITLADARARAIDARRLLADGIDPIHQRRQTRTQAKLDVVKALTFAQCAEQYIASHKARWRHGTSYCDSETLQSRFKKPRG